MLFSEILDIGYCRSLVLSKPDYGIRFGRFMLSRIVRYGLVS